MDSIGDVIYIFVLIIFAVAGMIGKKKEKEKKARHQMPTPAAPNPWEDLEEQIRRKENAQKQEAESLTRNKPPMQDLTQHSEYVPVSSEAIYSSEYETPIYETMSYETVEDISTLRIKKQVESTVSKNFSPYQTSHSDMNNSSSKSTNVSFVNPEEAKKAFIYSEIFSRKYD
ncbi:MAG: hypothetical protein ACK5KP_05540 [Paludibacteraceae bacterium]